MSGSLYLAWRYLAYHRAKTSILVASIALILFLPFGLQVLVEQSGAQLLERARTTPLVIGARGSALELVLNSLYFESKQPEPSRYDEVVRIDDTGFAEPIPLLVRFQARGHPVVGTILEYLDFRGLRLATGRRMAVLGEAVLGAAAARDLGLAPGDSLLTSPESVFDLAGAYPLKLNVVGVLAPRNEPDDHAVFVDIKTSWVIQGLGHGHQDLAAPAAASKVLSRDDERITANASVVEYNEITRANIDSFHFHGDLDDYPLTAVIANAHDDKSRVLLMGRYQGASETVQIVQPVGVMNELLETVLTIQDYALAALVIVAAATLCIAALVFMLSLRLRRQEIDTMVKIGGGRGSVAAVLCGEVVVVLALAATLAGGLTLLIGQFGASAIRVLLL
jgi:putative ABC transport system permease protein